MDFKQFEYVLTVANERSFSKASKKLYISQPSLSQYISRIEAGLGVVLFDRTSVPLSLTYEGEIYTETAKNILSLITKMKNKYDDINALAIGKLNIGLTPSKANYHLPLILPVFKKKYPGIELKITEASSSDLEELISKDLVDIGLMNLPINNNLIDYESIYTEQILIVAPPDFCHKVSKENTYKDENKKFPEINLSDIAEEDFILLRHGQRIRQITDALFAKNNIKPKILLETGSIETSIRLSAANMGFSFVPESCALFSRAKNTPKYFTIGKTPLMWTTAVAYRKNTYHTKAAYAFIDTTKGIIGNYEITGDNRQNDIN